MTKLSETLRLAIEASVDAGKAILNVYNKPDFTNEIKADNSPLTEADLDANSIINAVLEQSEYPIISEENKNKGFFERRYWEFCWIVDPLDGTKEFIKKNGEFTVNIALCKAGSPILGVIYVPVSRELYYADVAQKMAYKSILDENHELNKKLFDEEDRIACSEPKKELVRVVGSRSHMGEETLAYIKSIEGDFDKVDIVSKGSSLKFCLVAEGKADVYPRFAPTMEWDTAAGHAICKAVGLKVISQLTKEELLYNKEDLLNPYFLVSK